jgi:hypothetical protein
MIALTDGYAYPLSPHTSLYRDHLNQALKTVFESGESPSAALRAASEVITEALIIGDVTPTPTP